MAQILSTCALMPTALMLLLFVPVVTAPAQTLSQPLVDIPSSSLAPPSEPLLTLPAASTNLLAPTAGNQAPPDALGANLQSISLSPYVYSSAGDHPAAAIDTIVRPLPAVGPGPRGSLSSRSLYTPAQATRWSGSVSTAGMKGLGATPRQSTTPASAWMIPSAPYNGIVPVDAGSATASLAKGGSATWTPAASRTGPRTNRRYSSPSETAALFKIETGNPDTPASFDQAPFASLDGPQESFLHPDLTAVLRPRQVAAITPDATLPFTSELARLRPPLHPPSYARSYGTRPRRSRVTMKSLMEREKQNDSTAPILPPFFFMSP